MSSPELDTAESPADIDTPNVDVVSDAPATDAPEETVSDDTVEIPGVAPDAPVLDENGEPVVPAEAANDYKPSFKYRAALQDREVEEFWRPLIKDKESEEKVIKAMQRLEGFDKVYESREKLVSDYETLEGDYQAAQGEITRFNDAVSKGDLTSAFRQVGLTDQQIFQWTQQRLQYMELPQEQRRALEESEQMRQQQMQVEQEKSQYQKMYEEQAVQTRTMHLDFVLSRPEVAQSASKWDAAMGEGAFRDLVVSEAQKYYYQTNQDLSADQAAQMVIQKFGKVLGGGNPAHGQPQAPGTVPPNPQTKPVIPNVSGKNASPIKKAITSIEGIKARAKELDSLDSN